MNIKKKKVDVILVVRLHMFSYYFSYLGQTKFPSTIDTIVIITFVIFVIILTSLFRNYFSIIEYCKMVIIKVQ